MKAEITFPPELVEEIVSSVCKRLKPLLNGKHEVEDTIMDKKALAAYLVVSESTINKMVCYKQIPHFKIQPGQSGGVRFSRRAIDRWIARQAAPVLDADLGKNKVHNLEHIAS